MLDADLDRGYQLEDEALRGSGVVTFSTGDPRTAVLAQIAGLLSAFLSPYAVSFGAMFLLSSGLDEQAVFLVGDDRVEGDQGGVDAVVGLAVAVGLAIVMEVLSDGDDPPLPFVEFVQDAPERSTEHRGAAVDLYLDLGPRSMARTRPRRGGGGTRSGSSASA